MAAQEPEALSTSRPGSAASVILSAPPVSGSLQRRSVSRSIRSSPVVLRDDAIVDSLAEIDSLDSASQSDSGHSNSAVLQDEPGEPGDDITSSSVTEPDKEDPDCRGKNNYIYPFKVKLEGAAGSNQPAMTDAHSPQSDTR